MTLNPPPNVYVVVYNDDCGAAPAAILGVFSQLQDANAECQRHAAVAGFRLSSDSGTAGPDRGHLVPVEPMRWDSPEGVSCWVEEHAVVPKQVLAPAKLAG
jgi:hypothetical protein